MLGVSGGVHSNADLRLTKEGKVGVYSTEASIDAHSKVISSKFYEWWKPQDGGRFK